MLKLERYYRVRLYRCARSFRLKVVLYPIAQLGRLCRLFKLKLNIYRQSGRIRAHLTNIFLGIVSSLLVWIGCEVQRRWRDEAYEQIELSLQETIAELDTTQEEEIQIRHRLEEYIDSPGKFRPENAVERQIVARFQEHLSEHQAGHNHISERKREEQFAAINLSIDELIRLTKELHKDPLLIDSCLIRLPIDSGEHATSKAIDELIHIGKITPSNGAHIRTLSNCLFGYSDKVLLEAQRIGSARVRTLSQTLNAVGKTVIGSSSQSLREIYSGYKKDQRAEQEQMLRLLIKSSLICLNFNDAYYFYDELLELNPTAELHAEYGRLLQIQNEVSAAITHYKVALELFEYERTRPTQTVHRTRGQEADVQNNLAILLQKNNDLEAAQQYYHKALRSYRLLAKHKNKFYQSDIAMTLNNLSNLHMKLNSPQKALQYYQQALQLYTRLYEQDETTYASHMATTLNNLAMTMKHTGQYSVAKAYYYQALGLKRKLARLQPDVYLPNVALTLNNLATLSHIQRRPTRGQGALSRGSEYSP